MVREDRRERPRHADDPEQVGLELVADVRQRRREYRGGQRNACVIYQDRDVGSRLRGDGNRGVVRRRRGSAERSADPVPVVMSVRWRTPWLLHAQAIRRRLRGRSHGCRQSPAQQRRRSVYRWQIDAGHRSSFLRCPEMLCRRRTRSCTAHDLRCDDGAAESLAAFDPRVP